MAAVYYQLKNPLLYRKANLNAERWGIRPKHVVYVYNSETEKSEHQPVLHVEGKK
jgi:hypothetical protein